jgi:hypothetical protein
MGGHSRYDTDGRVHLRSGARHEANGRSAARQSGPVDNSLACRRCAVAALLDSRLDALAGTVCANDPRTKDQRRADAIRPLARGESTLACRCGSPDCPGAAQRSALSEIVVNVLAEQAPPSSAPVVTRAQVRDVQHGHQGSLRSAMGPHFRMQVCGRGRHGRVSCCSAAGVPTLMT